MKTCTKCGETKALEAFNRAAASRDGLQAYCKACAAAYRAAYRAANRDAINAKDAAHYAANRDAILAQQAAYRAANRDAINVYQAAYYAENRDAAKVRKAARRAALKARPDDVIAAAQAESADTHTCRKCGMTPRQTKFYRTRRNLNGWNQECAECTRLRVGKYRAAVIEALTATENTECQGCYQPFTPDVRIEVDHMHPRDLEGANSIENYQLLCQPCNGSKRATPYYEWFAATHDDWTVEDMQAIVDFHVRRNARLAA